MMMGQANSQKNN